MEYIVILNFMTNEIDCFKMDNYNGEFDIQGWMLETHGYDMRNCEFMITEMPIIRPINF